MTVYTKSFTPPNAFENHPAAVNPNRGIDIQLVEHMVREAAEGKSVAL